MSRRRLTGACAAVLFTAVLLAGPSGAVAIETTPSAEPTAPPAASGPPTITVVAVGDLLFDSAPGRLIRAQGPRAPFRSTARILRGADVTVGNLENPLSRRGSAVPGKTFTFRGDPRAADGLKWAGFDLLALGNNHARDYGAPALGDTFANLRRTGIAYAGAGTTRRAAWRPAIIERNGAKIAFLSFSQIGPASFTATSERSGTAYTLNRAAVNRAIKAAGRRADYVIVSFHWGVERSYSANARQVADGRAAIRAGADLVLSHHPHVIQGVEYYRDGLIAYSLGNFVFSPGSMSGRDSMILRLTLSPKGVSKVSAVPVWIGYNGRPVVQQGESARRIIRIIKRTSAARGTRVTRSGSVARLRP